MVKKIHKFKILRIGLKRICRIASSVNNIPLNLPPALLALTDLWSTVKLEVDSTSS